MRLAYRTDDEIARWRLRDPLEVVGERLDDDVRARLDADIERVLDEAVEFARASERPTVMEALDFVYASGHPPRAGAL
jgi:pyruvate dehydrogenase E1 component alpha subunit